MKIAIVGPSPVPFTIGGIENLLWGITEYINQHTEHQAELIKLPSKEDNFWDLIETYKKFYDLNLDYFDMVISIKYPAWMVRHRNHICYLAHRLRGLYDTYHFMNLPTEVDRKNKHINKVLDYMEREQYCDQLDDFFALMSDLYSKKELIDGRYFEFPGPFIRKIVHYMDNFALSTDRIKKFYCISDTVKSRKEYFPVGVEPVTVYLPSFLKKYGSKGYNYIFTISRLDGPKRIKLLVKAMKYVTSDVNLIIAGTGPEEERLKKLAEGDRRIKFVGFVTDAEVSEYYSNSLVVPYLPYEEDYGLITIEAMMNKKPVITCMDSGGPNEFVKNNITGFSVKADPKIIAEKIDYFASNKDEAIRMGNNGYNAVKNITWENVINSLLGESNTEKKEKRKKIVVTSTFPIYPPVGGGQMRTYNLYKNVAKKFNVEIISFTNCDGKYFSDYIGENLFETRIPKSKEHQQEEWKIEKKLGLPVSDILMPRLSGYTQKYGEELRRAINECDIVVLSHPYLLNEVKKCIRNKPFIYEAQDIEYVIKKGILPDNKFSREILKEVYDIEKECCQNSLFIMTCSEEDRVKISEIYNLSPDKIIVVPNGVDVYNTKFTNIEERKKLKRQLNMENEKLALFVGSWHKPNLEACESIFEMAKKTPDVKYLLMGSQCLYFKDKKLPVNIGLLGVLDESSKQKVFDVVDIALNPMESGSGTNLKMFDYMASGIPVISTYFGTRGIENKNCMIISQLENMDEAVEKFDLNNINVGNMVSEARKYVEEKYDWRKISEILIKKLGC